MELLAILSEVRSKLGPPGGRGEEKRVEQKRIKKKRACYQKR